MKRGETEGVVFRLPLLSKKGERMYGSIHGGEKQQAEAQL